MGAFQRGLPCLPACSGCLLGWSLGFRPGLAALSLAWQFSVCWVLTWGVFVSWLVILFVWMGWTTLWFSSMVQSWWHLLVWLPAMGVCLSAGFWPEWLSGLWGRVLLCLPWLFPFWPLGVGLWVSSAALSFFWDGSCDFSLPFLLGLSLSPVWAVHLSVWSTV